MQIPHYQFFVFSFEAMSLGVPGLMHGEGGHVTPLTKMESLKSSAREFLSRIDLLEKRLLEVSHVSTHMTLV